MSVDQLIDRPDWASPPGQTIISILEDRELSLEQFAHHIGRSATAAQKILDGDQVIDVDLARQLAATLGASEKFWLAREHDYRASIQQPALGAVESITDLVEQLPLKDMKKFGWISEARNKDDKFAECLSFFGVSTFAQWQGRYEDAFRTTAYRRTAVYPACEIATTAWLRQGEIQTRHDEVADWSPKVLEDKIPQFRRLTWYKNPALFLPKLSALFAEAGVKLAVVRAPKGCTASGAVRITNDDVPLVQLSFRYLSDDQFWFSLFHEIAHLLLHYEKMPILESSDVAEEDYEREANEFAAQTIVPAKYREEFMMLGNSRFPIIAFAKKVGVAPGLIVGQLQYEGIIRYNQMQRLKRRFRWVD